MKLVICEGGDDQAVIEGLLAHAGLTGYNVEQYKGTDRLGSFLRGLPQRPEFTRGEIDSLGITTDADNGRAFAWQKVVDLTREAFGHALVQPGVSVGERPRIAGFVTAVGETGTLEDVCLQAVDAKPGFRCLGEYFRCLAKETGRPDYPAKARFRAWMASQADFDLRVGKAASEGYLPWDHAAFQPLRQFLLSL